MNTFTQSIIFRKGTLALLMSSVLLLMGCVAGDPAKTELAQCLTENDVTMYGSYSCIHCRNQKKTFGGSFDDVQYIECSEKGTEEEKKICEEKKITGTPTWINETTNERLSGDRGLSELAKFGGCEYNPNATIEAVEEDSNA